MAGEIGQYAEIIEDYVFKNDKFHPYVPMLKKVNSGLNVNELIDLGKEMKTNDIYHATQEHLPVHILN